MKSCCIKGCGTKSNTCAEKGISLHRFAESFYFKHDCLIIFKKNCIFSFPKCENDKRNWLHSIKILNGIIEVSKSAKICSLHFESKSIAHNFGRTIIKPSSIPNLNMNNMDTDDKKQVFILFSTIKAYELIDFIFLK